MNKAFVSILLAIIICLGLIPASIAAAPAMVWIDVNNGSMLSVGVIQSGSDLLFSGKDLAAITYYDYSVKDGQAIFARGVKTVRVDLVKNTVYAMEDLSKLSSIQLDQDVQSIDGSYYFSGAQLLPWLNTTCFQDGGTLYAVPDPESLWDIAGEFNPDEMAFSFSDACSIIGKSSKWLKASAYIRDNGVGMLFDVVPMSLDFSVGSYLDYCDIFDDLFLDKESTINAVEDMMGDNKKINALFGIINDLDGLENLPEEFQGIASISKGLATAGKAVDFALYCETFQQDNRQKIEMMKAITENSLAYDFPEAMISAAISIKNEYADIFEGAENRLLRAALDLSASGLIDAATGTTFIKWASTAIGLGEVFAPDWVEGVNRISKYESIAACSLDYYNDNSGRSHTAAITDQRCHAMLYLYANEQCFRAMQSLAESKGRASSAIYFGEKADLCSVWYGKFLATASGNATINDSHEYGSGHMKEEYTLELITMFAGLEKHETDSSISLPLTEYVGMTCADIKTIFEGRYKIISGGSIESVIGGDTVTFNFSPPDDGKEPAADSVVLSVFLFSDTGGITIDNNTHLGQTYAEIKSSLTPTTDWQPLQQWQRGVYTTNFSYRRNKNEEIYHISIGFDGLDADAKSIYAGVGIEFGNTPEELAQLGD